MVSETPQKRRVGDGTPGPGRPKGSQDKTTRMLKEAILLAAESVGENGKGKDGLTGYLRRVALKDVKAFSTLLGKVLPLQIDAIDGTPLGAPTVVQVYLPDNGRPPTK